jgi:hypothetical protein
LHTLKQFNAVLKIKKPATPCGFYFLLEPTSGVEPETSALPRLKVCPQGQKGGHKMSNGKSKDELITEITNNLKKLSKHRVMAVLWIVRHFIKVDKAA